jgi:hypothetical protein
VTSGLPLALAPLFSSPQRNVDSQQDAMPPSQTDDDQYDQGTVQREP